MADSKLEADLKKLFGQMLEDVKRVEKKVDSVIAKSSRSADMEGLDGAIGAIGNFMEEMSNRLEGIVEWQNYINSRLGAIEKAISGGVRQNLRPAAENLQQATDEQRKTLVRKNPQESSAVLKASHKAVQDFLKRPYDK